MPQSAAAAAAAAISVVAVVDTANCAALIPVRISPASYLTRYRRILLSSAEVKESTASMV